MLSKSHACFDSLVGSLVQCCFPLRKFGQTVIICCIESTSAIWAEPLNYWCDSVLTNRATRWKWLKIFVQKIVRIKYFHLDFFSSFEFYRGAEISFTSTCLKVGYRTALTVFEFGRKLKKKKKWANNQLIQIFSIHKWNFLTRGCLRGMRSRAGHK